MSVPGRSQREHRRAEREGTPVSAHGRSNALIPGRAARGVLE